MNLPDTVGYATPKTYGEIFSHLLAKLPILKQKNIVLSCHCHDDLGLAVANSLAAIESGARQAECTDQRHRRARRQRGHGRNRHGPAHAPRSLQRRHPHRRHQNLSASRMVSTLTGLIVQRNKAIVGENAFAHEAGIHQDGILKKRETYEIMDPATIGIPKTSWFWANIPAATPSATASLSWATP